ncbi:hypothetical protein B0H14DRAFT_3149179 [Mycena olivaceomarginata]|nr:hypothetical protein B0H14DRAFT_3149179 [Mycena olivaceomarginata]
MSEQYEQWLIRPQSGTAMWLCEGTRAEGQVNEKKCDEKEKRQENKGQIGVHGGGNTEAKLACMEEGMQRPNRRAWRRGAAEAKSACKEERGCRGQIGMHRGGMQRPNQRAWRRECRGQIGMHGGENAEAKSVCMEERGCRGQIGVHRESMERPIGVHGGGNAEAKSACMGERMQRPNRCAWRRGDAEAKSVCTERAWRGQIGVHGGGNAEAKSACMEERMQRPNRCAWRRGDAEAKSVCMEERGCRGQIGVHREGMQRPNRLAWRRGDAEAKSVCMEERGRRGQIGVHRALPRKDVVTAKLVASPHLEITIKPSPLLQLTFGQWRAQHPAQKMLVKEILKDFKVGSDTIPRAKADLNSRWM